MNLKRLQHVINEALEDQQVASVLLLKDIGNATKLIKILQDDTDLDEYDAQLQFEDQVDDPTMFIAVAYHKPGEFVFYDEDGDELDLEVSNKENDDFPDEKI